MGMIDILGKLVGATFKESMSDMIRVESMEDDQTLILKDGTMLSMIQVSGALRQPGEYEIARMVEDLRIMMAAYFTLPGHAIEVNFMRDAAAAKRHIERLVGRSKRAARNLGLDLDDVLDERITNLSKKMVTETCLISIYTRTSALSAEEAKVDSAAVQTRMNGFPGMKGAQIKGKGLESIHTKHTSLVDGFAGTLKNVGQLCRVLNVEETLQEIRAGIYPETYPHKDEWTPNLPYWSNIDQSYGKPGAKTMSMMPDTPDELRRTDYSNLGVPTFDMQLATRDSMIENSRTVRIGDMAFQAFDMTLAPEVLPNFNTLVMDITAKSPEIPWRSSVRIESGGVQAQALKMMYLSIFTWASPTVNKRIKEAIAENIQLHGREDTIVRFRMSFSTWAPTGQQDILRRNAQVLSGAVKRWGNSGVDGVSGDPLATVLSVCPGVTTGSTAPVASAPLSNALAMLPLARQASPWENGAVVLRTTDGKPWPYQPGSSKQSTWITLLIGTPGSGKSVAMNAINFASAITPSLAGGDNALLPRIAITDIGSSSGGVISLLQEALPANRRHEVVFQKLKNSISYAINIFDTQPGMRRPMSSERTFLINFMTLVCSDGETPPSGPMRGLIAAAIDRAYEDKMDHKNANRYLRDDQPQVDRALDELQFEESGETIWWEVVDFLFANGRIAEAEIAQRQAVPLISDLVSAAQAEQIAQIYREVVDPQSNQPLLAAFQRVISEVVAEFPILASSTKYSIGAARIVSMDLMDVTAKGTGAAAKKQTAMMYMLASQVMTRDFFLDKEEIVSKVVSGDLPPMYREWHIERAETNLQVPKIICMDEFHRTGRQPALTDQIIQYGREGRKFNIDVKIASQLIEDFPEPIIEIASSLVVCNAGSEHSIEYMNKMFKLTQGEQMVMRNKLTGPTKNGAPLWVMFKTKDEGQVRQELLLTLGPAELWAFSTTAEDVALRSRLYEEIGPKMTRKVLAARYPGGSAKSDIEKRIRRLEEQGERLDDEGRANIIGLLVEDLKKQSYMMSS